MNKISLSKLITLVFIIFLSCTIGMQGCQANYSNLKFAQVSDVHYSSFEGDTSYKLLTKSGLILDDAIYQINSTPNIDFTMFTGDMTNLPKETEVMSFFQHANLLDKPWYTTFGNHDISHSGKLTKNYYLDLLNGHNKYFCSKLPYYSFSPKKHYKVISLDTIIDYRMTSQGEISEEQLKWLKKELDNSKRDIVVIFTHVPVIEPFPSENHRLINSYELKLLLKKYDIPIIICSGHYHCTKIFQEDNILYISTPSLVTYPCAFRIINICPKRNKLLVDIYFKETNLRDLQTKAKNCAMGSVMLYGLEQDRNVTIELPRKRSKGYEKANTELKIVK